MLTKEESRKLTQKVLAHSKFPECEVSLSEREQSFLRFANNGVTTSGLTVQRTIEVSSTRDGRTGTSQTSQLDDASLAAAVRRSEELAHVAPVNPERVESVGPQKYSDHDNWDGRTAVARSDVLVPQVRAVIEAARGSKLVAAGFFDRVASISAIANKKGNFGYARGTDSRLSTTVRAQDGSSSGWAAHPTTRIAEINGAELGARAIQKCLAWKKPARIDPGKYMVVLEPTAVADLVQWVSFSLQARAAEEGRTFLSAKGGGTLLGEKLFPESVTLWTDPFDRRFPTDLWGSEGLPNTPITWIEKGVVKNLTYDRYWALKLNKQPTPSSTPLILDGGSGGVADLISSTERGLLVTRFWYIRLVNPQTLQLTGLTRDGLFLIEKGKITQPVMNLRFTDSPVRLLQNVQKLAAAVRVSGAEGNGMAAPPLSAAEFTFTSVSDAV